MFNNTLAVKTKYYISKMKQSTFEKKKYHSYDHHMDELLKMKRKINRNKNEKFSIKYKLLNFERESLFLILHTISM